MINVGVNSSHLDAILNGARLAFGDTRPLMALLGKSLEVQLRAHFLSRDGEGNKRGWPSKHFWNTEVRGNTALRDVTESRATVAIASPAFAHKVEGGTITAKRSRFLAIPMTAEAYRAGSPREAGMTGLFHVPGTQFLARNRGRGKSAALEIQYMLVASVTQARDPRALPSMEDVGRRLAGEAVQWIEGKMRKTA
jgi:hypothetical protein